MVWTDSYLLCCLYLVGKKEGTRGALSVAHYRHVHTLSHICIHTHFQTYTRRFGNDGLEPQNPKGERAEKSTHGYSSMYILYPSVDCTWFFSLLSHLSMTKDTSAPLSPSGMRGKSKQADRQMMACPAFWSLLRQQA